MRNVLEMKWEIYFFSVTREQATFSCTRCYFVMRLWEISTRFKIKVNVTMSSRCATNNYETFFGNSRWIQSLSLRTRKSDGRKKLKWLIDGVSEFTRELCCCGDECHTEVKSSENFLVHLMTGLASFSSQLKSIFEHKTTCFRGHWGRQFNVCLPHDNKENRISPQKPLPKVDWIQVLEQLYRLSINLCLWRAHFNWPQLHIIAQTCLLQLNLGKLKWFYVRN